MFFCQTVKTQYSKTTARTRHSRKRPQTKPRLGQSYTVTLVAFRPKPRFTQKNEVDVCMHHMITNIRVKTKVGYGLESFGVLGYSFFVLNNGLGSDYDKTEVITFCIHLLIYLYLCLFVFSSIVFNTLEFVFIEKFICGIRKDCQLAYDKQTS